MSENEKEPAYFIEIEDTGCRHCTHGQSWRVVGPDGIAESTTYTEEEDAQYLADSLSDAYEKGLSAGIKIAQEVAAARAKGEQP